MIGQADQGDDDGARRQPAEEIARALGRGAPPNREYAAVDMKADDPVHDRLGRDIDRYVGGRRGEEVGNGRETALRNQHGFERLPALRQQHPQHDLALGDEALAAPDKVALAHPAVGRHASVVETLDRDQVPWAPRIAAQADLGLARKKRSISRLASGPRGSV